MSNYTFLFTLHFKNRAQKRLAELDIPFSLILETAENPQQIMQDALDESVSIHQSIVELNSKQYLCRVFLTFTSEPPTLISFYITSKLDKYLQQ